MKTRLTLHKSSLALLLCATLAGACAGPQLRVPRASQDSVEVERQRQLGLVRNQKDIAFYNQIERWRRVFGVYSRLRTAGADLCKSDVAPQWGVFLKDLNGFPGEEREHARRVLNLDSNVLILATSGNAAAAGLRAGDTVTRIDGVALPNASPLNIALDVFQKAGMRPVEIEISRDGRSYSTVLMPELGCRYPVKIENNPELNASADGAEIEINTALIKLTHNDDELAYALSHEMAHNVLGHSDRKKSNASIGTVVGAIVDIGLLIGTRVNTQGAISRAGGQAGVSAYSQEFEREADYMSLYFMARAGFDVTKAPDVQRKFGIDDPRSIIYGSTHPSTPERAANLELAIQEVAGKVVRNEPLAPTQLANQNVTTQDAKIDAVTILQHQVKIEPKRQAPEQISALRPIVADRMSSPVRRAALLTHVKGRTMSSPPTVLQAEYLEIEEGRGTSRVIYPGNYSLEGEFRIQARDQRFKGVVASRLIDPDKFIVPSNSSQKGFAAYSGADGTVMECSFSVSNDGSINQGTCSDNRGNQYRVSY